MAKVWGQPTKEDKERTDALKKQEFGGAPTSDKLNSGLGQTASSVGAAADRAGSDPATMPGGPAGAPDSAKEAASRPSTTAAQTTAKAKK